MKTSRLYVYASTCLHNFWRKISIDSWIHVLCIFFFSFFLLPDNFHISSVHATSFNSKKRLFCLTIYMYPTKSRKPNEVVPTHFCIFEVNKITNQIKNLQHCYLENQDTSQITVSNLWGSKSMAHDYDLCRACFMHYPHKLFTMMVLYCNPLLLNHC